MKTIWERLKEAQNSQKNCAEAHRTNRNYKEGDHVFTSYIAK
jgi:hypothetical protein